MFIAYYERFITEAEGTARALKIIVGGFRSAPLHLHTHTRSHTHPVPERRG
jgi:hypothetical protein